MTDACDGVQRTQLTSELIVVGVKTFQTLQVPQLLGGIGAVQRGIALLSHSETSECCAADALAVFICRETPPFTWLT